MSLNLCGAQPGMFWIILYKSHNAPVPYPIMHHFVTEMCTCVHISVTKWCIVGFCLTHCGVCEIGLLGQCPGWWCPGCPSHWVISCHSILYVVWMAPSYTSASTKLIGGYTGITLSVCPSVCLWTESCPLCIFNNTHRIYFIFAHLIKQLQKVCRV